MPIQCQSARLYPAPRLTKQGAHHRALTAGVTGVRLHDLRHTYASFGAGGGLGLPIIGRLLGHSQPATTARYAHLDNDPLRRASEAIAGRIATALEGKKAASVMELTEW